MSSFTVLCLLLACPSAAQKVVAKKSENTLSALWSYLNGRQNFELSPLHLGWTGLALIALGVLAVKWNMIQARATQTKSKTASVSTKPSLWASWRISPEREAEETDPGLLQKYTSFKTFSTSKANYPSIRIFYRPHSQADKLPAHPSPLPLLVFVHGVGGCLANFSPMLTSLINVAPCLGIDLPGSGRSGFAPRSWEAYTPEALAELVAVIVKEICRGRERQGIVFIGHSLGCTLTTLATVKHLTTSGSDRPEVLGLVGLCPRAGPFEKEQQSSYRRMLRIPTPIFDVFRAFDRRKGLESASITQFAGKEPDPELRVMQMNFNRQSRTPVFRRFAWGAVQSFPGAEIWSELNVPVFLIAGEADTVTTPGELVKISESMGKRSHNSDVDLSVDRRKGDLSPRKNSSSEEVAGVSQMETTVILPPNPEAPQYTNPFSRTRVVLKTCILPAPAAHGLPYAPSTYRTVAGLVQTFLSSDVDTRLSLGWQLQHLSTEGKWDVKNLAKWQSVAPVSAPIGGVFRALKTLREIDEVHSPENFAKQWKGRISAVVDISHESPVYDPKGLQDGGIEYHKIPTVSKIPPTSAEVREFIQLIDRLRGLPSSTISSPSDDKSTNPSPTPTPQHLSSDKSPTPLIGVHCHYGFNRTGFFICAYLIEREGFAVQAAIDEFARGRPDGIKHAHFLDMLWVRYCVGLKRAPTM